jgi:hypothetical protein
MEAEHASLVAAEGRTHQHEVHTASITGPSPLTLWSLTIALDGDSLLP